MGQVERGSGDLAAPRGVEGEIGQGPVPGQGRPVGGQDDLERVEVGSRRGVHLQDPGLGQFRQGHRHRSRPHQVRVIGDEQLDRDDVPAGDPGQPHRQVDARFVGGRGIGQDQPRAAGTPGRGGVLGAEVGEVVVGVRLAGGPSQALAGLDLGGRTPFAGVVLAGVAVLEGVDGVDDPALGVQQLNRVGAVLPFHVGGEVPVGQDRAGGLFVGDYQHPVRRNGRFAQIDGAVGLAVAAVDAHQAPAG